MLLQYILKLSISLSVVYLFYQLLLRRLTFYTLNRWYLIAYSVLCFVIPFINVFTFVSEPAWRESAIISYIPALDEYTTQGQRLSAASFSWMQIVTIIIVIGMAAMIIRLLIQYYSLFKIRSRAVLLYDEKVKLYHIDKPVIPFSFGKAIFVNRHQHNEEELKEIIRHEFIHVKQRHSLDILWSELLCIVNWYNPFAWLLRKDIRQNLEFIADQQVLQTGLDRKQYQYLLLKVVGVNAFSIASNFNFSSLKKRIAMMNKTKSAKVHLLRFLFILPLLVVILLAFRNTGHQQQQQQHLTVSRVVVTDTVPTGKKISAQDIESMTVIKDKNTKTITVTLKNGQVEKYDVNDPKEQEAFETKYGKLPEPPKPPASPAAPEIVTVTGPPAPPAPPTVSLHEVKVVSGVSSNPKVAADAKPVANASLAKVVVDSKPVTSVDVQSKPVTTVNVKPLAVGNPEPVAVKDSRAVAVAPVVVADAAPEQKHVMVLDNFQGVFNDPKHLPSEIVGLINKTDNEDQLKRLQKNMEARGYKLELDNTTYVNGVLANVTGKVSKVAEGESGAFSATDFDNILLIESTDHGKYAGFHIVIKSGNKAAQIR